MNVLLAEMMSPEVEATVTFWAIQLGSALAILLIGWKLGGWVSNLVEKRLDAHHIDPTLKPFLKTLVSMLIRAGVVIAAVGTAGVEATSFAALFASVGLAVGMALSGTLQNFAGGVILLILRPFQVGDVIEAQGFAGKVKAIQIFQTILLTADNKMVHIPNGKLSNDSLINYSTMPDRRVDLVFGIGYDDDIDQAREVIMKVINSKEEIFKTPEPMVKVGELADSSVNFTIRVWTKSEDYWGVFFDLNEELKKAMDEVGISIPYPQTDVHIHQISQAG